MSCRSQLAGFARYPLTFGPTPIEYLSRLTAALGGSVEIYAKREDCNSGLAFGGNKLRKLEYILPDAIASGADTLVTTGGIQSNHTRLVAAVAAKLGMKCRLIQQTWVPDRIDGYDRVGNMQLSRVLGAKSAVVDHPFDIDHEAALEAVMSQVRSEGGIPYWIPAGASRHPLGGLGYVAFSEEVQAQEQQFQLTFDFIVTASVTGSTQAGMIAGFARAGRARAVIGIDASGTPSLVRAGVAEIASNTSRMLGDGLVAETDVVLREEFAYPAYGVPSEETLDAICLVARLEGMITDPVYEGKSAQALISMVRDGYFPAGSRILYVHLGGAPALNAYPDVPGARHPA